MLNSVDALLLRPRSTPPAKCPSWRPTVVRMARAVRVAGKVRAPVFVEEIGDDAASDSGCRPVTATWWLTMGAGSIGGFPAKLGEKPDER